MASLVNICLFLICWNAVSVSAQSINFLCMMAHCSSQSATCMFDSNCRKAISCIQPCGSNQTCVFRCLSSYADPKFDAFMECAVTQHNCVTIDPPDHPVQCNKPTAVVQNFTLADIAGAWYIVKGLNPVYDCFDCQISTFTLGTRPNTATVKELYDAVTIDGNTKQLETDETVTQKNPLNGGILNFNSTEDGLIHIAEFRVLDYSREHGYVFMYYCGGTGAWVYEGSIVYSKKPALDATAIDRIASTAKLHGYNLTSFCSPKTNNCISN